MKKIVLSVLITSLPLTHANAIELDGELLTGFDNNPFKLSDTLDHHDGWFIESQLRAKQQLGDFRLRGSLENRFHEGSIDDADTSKIKVDGRYRKKHTLFDKKATSHILLSYQDFNKTYVARSTGKIGTFSLQTIEDRYDYGTFGAEARTSLTLNKQIRTGLRLNFLHKNYQDFDLPGLSNLDYDQYRIRNDWNYRPSTSSRYTFVISGTQRRYDDKRQKTLAGLSIDGTDLEYDYFSVSLAHTYRYSSKLNSNLKFEYRERSDNGTGFYDTDLRKATARVNYITDEELSFGFSLMYQNLHYVHSVAIVESDDDNPGKEGYTMKFDVEKNLDTFQNMPVTVFSGIRFDDFNSNDPAYEYDRAQIFAGLQIKFT